MIRKRYIGFFFLGILLLVMMFVLTLTHLNRDRTHANRFYAFTIEHHLWVMALLVVVSVAFGFVWSIILYKELATTARKSKTILSIVLQFLGEDERKILNHIVQKGGRTTQADISRIEGMNKVKAYRCTRKMEEKNILTVSAHGKVRRIELKGDVLELLTEDRT